MRRFTISEDKSKYFDGLMIQNTSAIHKSFAKVLPQWSLVERKLFFALIECINWRKGGNGNTVTVENKYLIERLEWIPESQKDSFSKYVIKTLRHMCNAGEVYLQKLDDSQAYMWGKIFYHAEGDDEITSVTFNERMMPFLEDLVSTKSYYTYWLSDIYSMNSKHAQSLYFDMVAKSKYYGTADDTVDYTTRQMKNLFGLTVDQYTDTNGKLIRQTFEKRTIDKAIEEINKCCKYIKVYPFVDEDTGKETYYEKSYKGKKVYKYIIRYRLNSELMNEAGAGKWWYDNDAFRQLKELNREAEERFEM